MATIVWRGPYLTRPVGYSQIIWPINAASRPEFVPRPESTPTIPLSIFWEESGSLKPSISRCTSCTHNAGAFPGKSGKDPLSIHYSPAFVFFPLVHLFPLSAGSLFFFVLNSETRCRFFDIPAEKFQLFTNGFQLYCAFT